MDMFCPACEEEVSSPQPDGICLTCGEDLVLNTNNQNQPQTAAAHYQNDGAAAAAVALLASNVTGGTIDPSLMPFVNQLQGNDDVVNDLAEILPPEALNPQAGETKNRPASQTALDNLKRIVLTPQSSELFDAQISLFEPRPINDLSPPSSMQQSAEQITLNAVPGEFTYEASHDNATDEHNCIIQKRPRTAALVVCSPRTTKGGKLSSQTLSEIALLRQHRMPFVAYVERGDSITFVQKALVCQRAGEETQHSEAESSKSELSLCAGVIVGNTASSGCGVWPYVMQDNKHEAQTYGLKVPVVMIRREDGIRLVEWAKRKDESGDLQYTPCQLVVRSKEANSHTCPVCTDAYVPGATIIRLPLCGHVFHDSCALAWLTKHNTCPYCRKELPTDDEDYERTRRRREALGTTSGDANGHNFYG